jgi:hypothetical protein
VAANKLLFRTRDAILCIVGVGDGLRDGAHRREGVDGSQGTGELVRRKWIVVSRGWIWFRNYFWRKDVGEEITLRFMESLVLALFPESVCSNGLEMNYTGEPYRSRQAAYPAPLETVLRAEKAIATLLEACWALESACDLVAIHAHAFPRGDFRSHGR